MSTDERDNNEYCIDILNSVIKAKQEWLTESIELATKEKEMSEKTLTAFDELKNPIRKIGDDLFETIRHHNLAEGMFIYDNKMAKNKDDSARNFISIFYYPKGKKKDEWGLSVPSIQFEAMPKEGKISIKSSTSIPSPMELIRELEIDFADISKTKVELKKYVLDFFKKMAVLSIKIPERV